MPKIKTPPIGQPTGDVPDSVVQLQRRVIVALQSVVTQINNNPFTSEPALDNLDMNGFRIINLKTPASDGDAVNLGYLKRSFKGGQQGDIGSGAGDGFYEIVYFNSSDMAVGTQAQYNVGLNRTGQPIEANISALSVPTGASIKVNFLVNGTTTVLASDLTLPAGTSTVVLSTSINSGVVFRHSDMVELVVNQIGSTIPGSRVSVGLVVRRF